MSGGRLYIPPCFITTGSPMANGSRKQFVPTLGPQAPSPAPDPNNLVSQSPPTLLEAYELFAVSIVWGGIIMVGNPGGTITGELQLYINGERRWSADDTVTINNFFSGAWTADLVNPITVGARDRLGVQVAVEVDGNGQAPGLNLALMLAAYPNGAGAGIAAADWNADNSTISYNTIQLPASRRL